MTDLFVIEPLVYILLTYDRCVFIFYKSLIVLSAVDVGGI